MQRDKPPVVLTVEEFRGLRLLAEKSNLTVGEVVRRLIASEVSKLGMELSSAVKNGQEASEHDR